MSPPGHRRVRPAACGRNVEGVRVVCGPGAGACPRRGNGSWARRPHFFRTAPLLPRTPEVPLVRQLSVPVRWAAVVAATVAASTGCMSVGDDEGKPAPSSSPEHAGSAARPDGGTVAGTGRVRTGGGRAEAHSEREAVESPEPGDSAGPSHATGGVRPGAEPGGAEPPRGTVPPAPSASHPGPGVPQQPESPVPSAPPTPGPPSSPEPEPEPSEPPSAPPPSASPAAQLRSEATGASARSVPLRTPEASPQVGPV